MEKPTSAEILLAELKHYIELRWQFIKYFSTEKLSYIFAALIFTTIGLIFGAIVICYFSQSLLHLLQIYVGTVAAYAIVGAAALSILFIICWQRKRWILNPITRALYRVFIDNDNEKTH
jgi:hypothetical protein